MMGLAEVPTVEKLTELQNEMENNLKLVENVWLKDKDFLTGNKLTAADLFGACEIEQTSKITKLLIGILIANVLIYFRNL